MLIYVGGYHLFFAWHQANIKTQMKAYLKKHTNSKYGTTIQLNTSNNQIVDPNFSWEEEGAEFRYHDLLYDVVSIEHFVGSVTICCIKDNSENQLEQQLNDIQKTQKNKQDKSILQIKYFSNFCFQNVYKFVLYPIASNKQHFYITNSYLSRFIQILTPPPKACVS